MPPVLFDHGSAKAEAQTHAFGLGGEKGREQLFFNIVRDAHTDIADRKLYPSVRQTGSRTDG